jgi:signal transduction histidine kinase
MFSELLRKSPPARRDDDRLVSRLKQGAGGQDREGRRRAVLTAFREWAETDATRLLVRDGDSLELTESGTDSTPAEPPTVSPEGRLLQWLAVNRTGLLLPDRAGVFEYLEPNEQRLLMDTRLCLPLLDGEEVAGVVLFGARPQREFSRQDVAFLLPCGEMAATLLRDEAEGGSRASRKLHRADQLATAGQLAATIAHEVRNPLSTIRSTIQYVIDSGSAWERKRDLLGEMFKEVDRIDHTMEGILTLSRPGGQSFQIVDLAEVIGKAVQLVIPYATKQDVSVETRVAGALRLAADERELRQVFVNLFLNACQAMAGGGRLTIEAKTDVDIGTGENPAARLAVIHIIDTGSGISPELSDRVFEPFFTTKTGGTGLGLSVCLEIVTRHGGTIRLSRPENGGTQVTITLPIPEP